MKRSIRNIVLLAVAAVVLSVTATFSALPGDARQVSAPTPPISGEAGAATRVAHRGGGLLQFSRTSYRVRETDQHATIRVERLGSLNGTVTVAYTTSPGTALAGLNYTTAAGTLTFAEGVKTQRFMVQVQADGQVTGNKTVFLTLSAPAGGARLGPQRRAVLTIVNTDVALTGTAAAGAPLASRLIRIKDKNGARRTGTTDTGGKFTVAVTGLAPTFLVKVEPPGVSSLPGPVGQAVVLGRAGPPVATPLGLGRTAVLTPVTVLDPQTTPLFSVGTAEAGVVNVHPFTDLIIRTWYEVQGTTVETVFDAPTTDPPAPSAEQVAVIASLVKDMLNIWLVAQGLDPITFDLIATPFDADGAGFDAVLEQAVLEVNALTETTTVTLTNATTSVTQTTALSVAEKVLSALTATTGQGGAASGSLTSGVVPTDPAVQTALNGVLTSLQSFAAVVNSKGAALSADDLLTFFDLNYRNNGFEGQFIVAAQFATEFREASFDAFRVDRILSYDDAAKVLCIAGTLSVTQLGSGINTIIQVQVALDGIGGVPAGIASERGNEFCFRRQDDATWRVFGNQQRMGVTAEVAIENRSFGVTCVPVPGPDCDGTFGRFSLSVAAPKATIEGVTVNGSDGSLTTLEKVPAVFITTLRPSPNGPPLLLEEEHFAGGSSVRLEGNGGTASSFAPVGTRYTFTATPTNGGPPVIVADILGATTEEAISIVGIAEDPGFTHQFTEAPGFISFPSFLHVEWTLPITFPIEQVELRGFLDGSLNNELIVCIVPSDRPVLPLTATFGIIPTPPPLTCGEVDMLTRNPIPDPRMPYFIIEVVVTGTHGEKTRALWGIHG